MTNKASGTCRGTESIAKLLAVWALLSHRLCRAMCLPAELYLREIHSYTASRPCLHSHSPHLKVGRFYFVWGGAGAAGEGTEEARVMNMPTACSKKVAPWLREKASSQYLWRLRSWHLTRCRIRGSYDPGDPNQHPTPLL